MKVPDSSAEALFYCGNYREFLSRTLDKQTQGAVRPAPISGKLFPLVIGALTFQNRIEEAEALYRLQTSRMSQSARFTARFFLGIGLCRFAQYSRSRKYLIENLRLAKHARDPKVRFFARQGLAFYRYFEGRYQRARIHAEKSLGDSTQAEFHYGKALSLDLLGHCLVQLGEIALGTSTLRQAIREASLLATPKNQGHNHGMIQSIELSLLNYQAQFQSLPSENTIARLQQGLDRLTPQNVYSRASLLLEIANQQTLLGRLDSARTTLDQASQLIYGTHHRRYAVLLNVRYAHLCLLAGQPNISLQLLDRVICDLDARMDQSLESTALGLKRRVLRVLRPDCSTETLDRQLEKLANRTRRALSLRILNRDLMSRSACESAAVGFLPEQLEDQLAHHLDQLSTHSALAISHSIRSGVLALLPGILNFGGEKSGLCFGLVSEGVLVIDRGNVEWIASGVSPILHTLAREISQTGGSNKQLLVERIWNYRYHPLQHDPLVYQAVSRLRLLLGKRSHWIEASDQGYRFATDLKIHFTGSHDLPTPGEVRDSTVFIPDGLNHRHLEILSTIQRDETIDVAWCMKRFHVSDMTARRDLVHLIKLGKLTRIGRARATRYVLVTGIRDTLQSFQRSPR